MIKKYVMKCVGMASAILCLGFVTTSVRASESFSFDDIHYWIGEGTNRAVVLIDFDFRGRAAGLSNSLAYGVRWNGKMTQLEALWKIAQEDRRLHFSSYLSGGSELPESFAYDLDGDGGAFSLSNALKTDPDDIVQSCTAADGWNFYWATAERSGRTYSEGFSFCMEGVQTATLSPNSFFGIMFLPWGDSAGNSLGTYDEFWNPLPFIYPETGDWIDFDPSFPIAAESPYGFRIVEYQADTMPQFAQGYTNFNAALGRPTMIDFVDVVEDQPIGVTPVTPFIPANSKKSVVRLYDLCDEFDALVARGSITIEFDHPVVDDPNNPWGLDFIVFGNAFYTGTSSGEHLTGTENPERVTVSDPPYGQEGLLNAEPALVEVSQDNVTWYAFLDGPYADSFAPTMGFLYDPANADSTLFEGNAWWGAPADPTYPVPPDAAAEIGVGTTLAQIGTWYNGSAGGTAYDIGTLALPATHKGLKWFKYVRITNQAPEDDSESSCEIDAVADVYPDTPYGLFAKARYTWPELATVGRKTALAANGRPNFFNFSLGESSEASLKISGFDVKDGRIRISFAVWKADWNLVDLQESGIDLGIRASGKLTAEGPVANPYGWARFEGLTANSTGGWTATLSVPAPAATSAFFRLVLSIKD